MQTNNDFCFSKELLKEIIDLQNKDCVAFATCFGIETQNVHEFIKQSADSILYDLNRDGLTTVTLARDSDSTIGRRWINDLAVAFVIKKLKDEIDELKQKYEINDSTKDIFGWSRD